MLQITSNCADTSELWKHDVLKGISASDGTRNQGRDNNGYAKDADKPKEPWLLLRNLNQVAIMCVHIYIYSSYAFPDIVT